MRQETKTNERKPLKYHPAYNFRPNKFSCPILPNTLQSILLGSVFLKGELSFANLFAAVIFVRVGVPSVHLSVAS
jgi:hypothetical protein